VSAAPTPDGMVRIAVRDSGRGLDGVDMQRLFRASYTTKADGTGLGLWVSRSIIEAHGGRLWAEPNPDGGATFAFTLPIETAATEPDALLVQSGRS
jgi:two-component system sensor kinase FixL